MGDVYRADDLKLGAPVALKFLPRSLEGDPARLTLLLEEVKLARQVSHPNVCRVWDAGETDGLHFVSMEYVDGEDLGSLLRRIGRLPEERGVKIAREICAGLAAIHDQGLLHRDLKPANIMVDGRGRVRIADFSLAAISGSVSREDVRSGTPGYMSPEQLEGRDVSARSDIYALGLVLYEVFTGRHAFVSAAQSTTRGPDSRPETPSSFVRTLDPLVERAILRCLEPDPAARPASALSVAAAFPGGDPLMAALAAGETPSPEMVAASGGAGGLSPLAAAALAVAIALGLIGVLLASDWRGLPFRTDDKPYAALRDRAEEFLRARGLAQPGDHTVDGFARYDAPGASAGGLSRQGVFYWYRRSSFLVPLVVDERDFSRFGGFALPALDAPGERALRTDLRGQLLEFRRVPSPQDSLSSSDWEPFFAAAGIGSQDLTPAEPQWVVAVPADQRLAWTRRTTNGSEHIEGTSYRGRITSFVVGEPSVARRVTFRNRVTATFTGILWLPIFVGFLLIARRNLLTGRADVRGAQRFALLILVSGTLGFHTLRYPRLFWPGSFIAWSLVLGVFFTLFEALGYLALEPMVRRQNPGWLTSWSRLAGGRWLDGLVGRDLLAGLLGGLMAALVGCIGGKLVGWMPHTGDYQAAAVGGGTALGVVFRGFNSGALGAMALLFMLVMLIRVVRHRVVAWGLWLLLAGALIRSQPLPAIWIPLLQVCVFGLVLTRFGVLGLMATSIVFAILNEEYVTAHLGAWYAGVSVAAIFAIGLLVAWGCVAATRPLPGGGRRHDI